MGNRFTNEAAEVSARMRRIRGKNTKAELQLFSILQTAGVPFKEHVRIGRYEVDAVVAEKIIVLVDSPFWHLRNEALLDRLSDHWKARLLRNRSRDRRARRRFRAEGFSVLRFWADTVDEIDVLRRVRKAIERSAT